MREISKDNLLRSWKDISAYLGCDVRTCHRWEDSHGMPVHRAEGGEKKSPVFAYKDELDAWFRETFRNSHEAGAKAGAKAGAGRPYLIWALGAAAVLVLAGAYFLLRGIGARRQPADFEIDGLVSRRPGQAEARALALGHGYRQPRDRRLLPARASRSSTRTRPTCCPSSSSRTSTRTATREVLFALRRQSDQTGEGLLYCFDRKGDETLGVQGRRAALLRRPGVFAGIPHRRVRRPRPRRRRQARDRGRVVPRARLALPAGRSRLRGEAPGRVLPRRLPEGDRLPRPRRRRPRGAHRGRGQQRVPRRLRRRVRPAGRPRRIAPVGGVRLRGRRARAPSSTT